MAFASTNDVAARLGRALTATESTSAGFLLEAAQGVIELAVEANEAAIVPLPPVLRFMAVELVLRAMANPSNLISEQETLGVYQHTERFRSAESELLLTNLEELMVRQAVKGSLSGSVRIQSHVDDIYHALIGS